MKAGDLLIDESEIVESFLRTSGPGRQNVNKVASAIELRLDARGSLSLPEDVAARLIRLAGARATESRAAKAIRAARTWCRRRWRLRRRSRGGLSMCGLFVKE